MEFEVPFVFLFIGAALSLAQGSCLEGCSCMNEFFGRCDSVLTMIPEQIPNNTRFINLQDHDIPNITAADFNGLSDLYSLTLVNNGIEIIEEGSFAELPRLHILNLRNNQLTVMTAFQFAGLPSLSLLYLENNHELILETCSLSSLTSLTSLSLQYTNVNFSTDLFVSRACRDGGFPNLTNLQIQGSNTVDLDPTLISQFNSTLVGLGIGRTEMTAERVTNAVSAVADTLQTLTLNQLPPTVHCEMDLTGLVHLNSLLLTRTSFVPDIRHGTVKNLYIWESNFTAIPPRAFANMTSLARVDIRDNMDLRYIHKDAFEELSDLSIFVLVNTNVTSLPEGLFSDSISLTALRLDENPWSCDCHMEWLIEMINAPPLLTSNSNTGACSSPDVLLGRPLKTLTPDELVSSCPTILENSPGLFGRVECSTLETTTTNTPTVTTDHTTVFSFLTIELVIGLAVGACVLMIILIVLVSMCFCKICRPTSKTDYSSDTGANYRDGMEPDYDTVPDRVVQETSFERPRGSPSDIKGSMANHYGSTPHHVQRMVSSSNHAVQPSLVGQLGSSSMGIYDREYDNVPATSAFGT